VKAVRTDLDRRFADHEVQCAFGRDPGRSDGSPACLARSSRWSRTLWPLFSRSPTHGDIRIRRTRPGWRLLAGAVVRRRL